MTPRIQPPFCLTKSIATLLAGTLCLAARVDAAPQGAQVAHGSASISQAGNKLTIRPSDNAVINYKSFNIDHGETVQFIQNSSNSRVLNRVTDPNPSHLFGTLQANGHVYLINPYGIYVESGAVITTGSFIAAAGRMNDADFLAGTDHFQALSGEVVNQGLITAKGNVSLFGANVANFGSLVAERGTVTMASGTDVLIGKNNGNVFVNASLPAAGASAAKAGVQNAGRVQARRAILAAGDLFSVAVSNTGIVKSSNVLMQGGAHSIVSVSGAVDASNTARGGKGGKVQFLGGHVELRGATVDASGAAGGGVILVGGETHGAGPTQTAATTSVDATTTLKADATVQGNGGKVVVWSNERTDYSGSTSARGAGSGTGGFAEVSGKSVLNFQGTADLSAPSGKTGTLLLDPSTLTITDDVTPPGPAGTLDGNLPTIPAGLADAGANTISRGALESLAGTVDLSLQATGQITVNNLAGNLLNLATTASHSVSIASTTSGGITFLDPNDEIRTAGGSLTLSAGGTGSLNLGKLTTNGGAIVLTSGQVTMNSAISGGSLTVASGTATPAAINFNGATVTTSGGDQTYTGNSTLGASTTLTSTTGTITLGVVDAAVSGAQALAINILGSGHVVMSGDVGLNVPLKSLSIAGGTGITLNGGTVTTLLDQSYGGAAVGGTSVGPVTLGAPTVLSSSGNGDVSFNSTVDALIDGSAGLVVTTSGTTTFAATVGGFHPLASLTVNGAGAINLQGPAVRTTGDQTYAGNVTLGPSDLGASTVAFSSSGSGDISFNSTVNAFRSGSAKLQVTTGGQTTFKDTVGATHGLFSVLIDGTGPIALNGTLIEAADDQTYAGDVTTGSSLTLRGTAASNMTFEGGLSPGSNAARGTINITGNLIFGPNSSLYVTLADSPKQDLITLTNNATTTTISAGAHLDGQVLSDTETPTANTPLTIIDGAKPVIGKFNNATVANPAVPIIDGSGYTIGYNPTGNVTLNRNKNTYTWNGGASGSWNAPSNWTVQPGGLTGAKAYPHNGDTVIFDGSQVDSNQDSTKSGKSLTLAELDFKNGANVTIDGNGLSFVGATAIVETDSTTQATINVPVQLIGDATFTVSKSLTFTTNGTVNGPSNATLTVLTTGVPGTGLVTFNGAVGGLGGLAVSIPANIGASITTSGAQTYGAVTVTATAPVTLTSGMNADISFGGAINGGSDPTAHSLTVSSGGKTTFNGAIAADAALADLTVTSVGDVSFKSSVDGSGALNVSSSTGTTTFEGQVGAITPFSTITVTGPATFKTDQVSAGDLQFNGAVAVGQDITFKTVKTGGGGTVVFGSTLDALDSTSRDVKVDVDATGRVTFTGSVGTLHALHNLETTLGAVEIDGAAMNTTGHQTYGGAVSISSKILTLTAEALSFAQEVTGPGTGALTLVAAGQADGILLNGATDVSVTHAMSIDFAKFTSGFGHITIGTASQDLPIFANALLLPADTTLNANTKDVHLMEVDSLGAARTFDVVTTGTTTFGTSVGVVADGSALKSLTVTGDGVTVLSGGVIKTVGDQYYGGALNIIGDVTINSGKVTVVRDLTATAGLTLQGSDAFLVSGNATLGGTTGLTTTGSLTVSGDITNTATLTVHSADFSVGGNADFESTTDLTVGKFTISKNLTTGAPLTVTSADALVSGSAKFGGNANFTTAGFAITGAVDSASSARDLTVVATGPIKLGSAVGATRPLGALSLTAPTIELDGGAVTTAGDQTYGGDLAITTDTTLTKTGQGGQGITLQKVTGEAFNLTLVSDVMTFGNTISGSGKLKILPNAHATSIELAGPATPLDPTALQISSASFANIGAFKTLEIGQAANGVAITAGALTGATALPADTILLAGSSPVSLQAVDSKIGAAARSLTIVTTGLTTLKGDIGAQSGGPALQFLSVSGGGATEVTGSTIKTIGDQTYGGALSTLGDVTVSGANFQVSNELTTSAGFTVTSSTAFGVTGNATFGGSTNLTSTGKFTFSGDLTGNKDFTVTGSNGFEVKKNAEFDGVTNLTSAADVTFKDVTTSADLTVNSPSALIAVTGNATLGGTSQFTAQDFTVNGAIEDSAAGTGHDLTVTATGTIELDGTVGATHHLGSLSLGGPDSAHSPKINLKGGVVTTSGKQTYDGSVTIDAPSVKFSAGDDIAFTKKLEGTNAPDVEFVLTAPLAPVTLNHNIFLNGGFGSADSQLGSLTTNAASTLVLGTVDNSGPKPVQQLTDNYVQTFTVGGSLRLDSDTKITGEATTAPGSTPGTTIITVAGGFDFSKDIASTDASVLRSLSLVTSGAIRLRGNILIVDPAGDKAGLSTLEVNAGDSRSAAPGGIIFGSGNSTVIHTAGTQTYTSIGVMKLASTVTFHSDGTSAAAIKLDPAAGVLGDIKFAGAIGGQPDLHALIVRTDGQVVFQKNLNLGSLSVIAGGGVTMGDLQNSSVEFQATVSGALDLAANLSLASRVVLGAKSVHVSGTVERSLDYPAKQAAPNFVVRGTGGSVLFDKDVGISSPLASALGSVVLTAVGANELKVQSVFASGNVTLNGGTIALGTGTAPEYLTATHGSVLLNNAAANPNNNKSTIKVNYSNPLTIYAGVAFRMGQGQKLNQTFGFDDPSLKASGISITAPTAALGDITSAGAVRVRGNSIQILQRAPIVGAPGVIPGTIDQGTSIVGSSVDYRSLDNTRETLPTLVADPKYSADLAAFNAAHPDDQPFGTTLPVTVIPTVLLPTLPEQALLNVPLEPVDRHVDKVGLGEGDNIKLTAAQVSELEELGIYPRLINDEEQRQIAASGQAVYRQPIEGTKLVKDDDFKFVVNRVTKQEVTRTLEVYHRIRGATGERLEDVRALIDNVAQRYAYLSGGVDAGGLGEWLKAEAGSEAEVGCFLEILQRLHLLNSDIVSMGLTSKEIEISRNKIAKIYTEGLSLPAADFRALIEKSTVAPGFATRLRKVDLRLTELTPVPQPPEPAAVPEPLPFTDGPPLQPETFLPNPDGTPGVPVPAPPADGATPPPATPANPGGPGEPPPAAPAPAPATVPPPAPAVPPSAMHRVFKAPFISAR